MSLWSDTYTGNCSLPCTHICNYNILMEFYPTLTCSSSLYNLAYDLVLLFGFLFCQSLLFGLPLSMGLGIVSFNSFFWSIAFQFFYSIVHPAFQFFCVLIWQPVELWNIPFFHSYFPWFTNILFEFLSDFLPPIFFPLLGAILFWFLYLFCVFFFLTSWCMDFWNCRTYKVSFLLIYLPHLRNVPFLFPSCQFWTVFTYILLPLLGDNLF